MSKRHRAFAELALIVLIPAVSFAESEAPGTVAAPILQVPIGARSVGMGTAFTAVTDDIEAVRYNPAVLGTLSYRGINGSFLKGFEDQTIQAIDGGWPLNYSGLFGGGGAVAGGSLLLSQNGSINVNTTNPDGSLNNSQTMSAGGDIIAGFNYAERLADTPYLTEEQTEHMYHYMGATAKVIRSSLVNNYSASAAAADLGYLVWMPELGVAGGASILNAGSRMKYIDVADELPLTGRMGGSYQFARYRPGRQVWTLAADGDYSIHEKQWHANAGVEYAFESVAARFGYQFHRDVAGLTIGFGVHLGPFVLDYAWAMSRAVSDTHRFGLTYQFSKPAEVERQQRQKAFITDSPEDVNQVKPSQNDNRKKQDQKQSPDWIY